VGHRHRRRRLGSRLTPPGKHLPQETERWRAILVGLVGERYGWWSGTAAIRLALGNTPRGSALDELSPFVDDLTSVTALEFECAGHNGFTVKRGGNRLRLPVARPSGLPVTTFEPFWAARAARSSLGTICALGASLL